MTTPLRYAIDLLIRGYQLSLGPLLGHQCRFYPSCSEYTRQAVLLHGAGAGLWLGLRRILRCHPWHAGGHDPVPSAVVTIHASAFASESASAPAPSPAQKAPVVRKRKPR